MDTRKMIIAALDNYREYRSHYDMLEQIQLIQPDSERAKELMLLKMRLTTIGCWVGLLDKHQAFVIRWVHMVGLEWKYVVRTYQKEWEDLAPSEPMLQTCHSEAISKIVSFALCHKDVIESLFGDVDIQDIKEYPWSCSAAHTQYDRKDESS